MKVSLPGIGGSLGECIYCGESFTMEVLMNRNAPIIGINGFGSAQLPIHEKCLDEMQRLVDSGKQWTSLPDGPLRKEYAAAFAGQEASGSTPRDGEKEGKKK